MLDRSRGGFLGGGSAGGTVTNDITMAAGTRIVLDDGTLAAPSLTFRSSAAGTGFSAQTADQIIQGRAGVAMSTMNSAGMTLNTTACNGGFTNTGTQRNTATVLATDSTLTTSQFVVVATSGCSTLTLPTTPLSGQQFIIHNRSGGALTVSRNGHTIDLATSNLTIASGSSCLLSLYSGTTGGSWASFEAVPA
jgi:hypothetical protein